MSTEYNYDEQGQYFPYFVFTIAAIIAIPTTYSVLKPSKGMERVDVWMLERLRCGGGDGHTPNQFFISYFL